MTNTEISQQVIQFISNQLSVKPEKIFPETSLNIDLGVDGDDASEFLEEFSKKFKVDLSDLKYEKHFGPEAGANPITILIWLTLFVLGRILNRKIEYNPGFSLIPITIQDLVDSANAGRWTMEYLPESNGQP
jgi:acyl carrier protein